MRAGRIIVAALALGWSAPAMAQDGETLADIRQQMSVLYVEIQKLKRELSTTGQVSGGITGTSALERIDSIEEELRRLTGKTEELEFRIESIVRDGTNRIGDLEFRLVELEGGDVSKLGDTSTLGGGAVPSGGTPSGGETQLAVGEEADFGRASEALANRDFRTAADLFAAFSQTYPGGPLDSAAHLGRGKALEGLEDTREAARAYLQAFSNNPESDSASEALYRLGVSLGALGQTSEACVMLDEVGTRYPASDFVEQARSARAGLNCQ